MSLICASSRFLSVATLVLAALLCSTEGRAQRIDRFPVPEGPSSLATGPDGAIWFLKGYSLARIDGGGTITDIPLGNWAGDITFASDGSLWYCGAVGGGPSGAIVEAWIGRVSPSGVPTEFSVPDAGFVTAGPDGNLWFSEVSSPRIGRITPSGTLTEFDLPTPFRATAITTGPDGNLWFTRPSANRIGRITLSGHITEFRVADGGQPYDIAAGPDGNLWFVEHGVRRIGRISPAGEITEFPTSSAAYAIVAGADGNLWAAGHGTLSRITPGGSITEFAIPTAGYSGWLPEHPSSIAAAPDGSIWIADYDNGQIVRFALEATSCIADGTTLCLNDGRFRVTADWRSRDGSAGQAGGIGLTSNSGYFWFFEPANVELVVKVLDGCSVGGTYWFFAAGLTNVEVTMTVTDTYSGISKTYTNPAGAPFAPIQDTGSFPCP